MLLESPTCRVHRQGRIAFLELKGTALPELVHALETVRADPFAEILVLRGGLGSIEEHEPADAIETAHAGRRTLNSLENLPLVTLAHLAGPATGRWLEVALACDYRLAVATPDAWIGFDDRPRWGSTARLRRLIGRDSFGTVTPREAVQLGLVDSACCERRERIELRSWLDRLEDRPRKRRHSWWASRRAAGADDRELAAYLSEPLGNVRRVASHPAMPIDSIELRRCPQAVPFAVEFVLVGGTVVTDDPEALGEQLEEPLLRGRVTPLELEQARNRVREMGRARLLLESESDDPFAIVRATLAPHSRPIRIGFPIHSESRTVEFTAGTASDRIAELFGTLGYERVDVAETPQLAVRPALAAYWDAALRLAAEGHPFDLIDDASRAVSHHPPLRTLDAIGAVAAASLAPRLRPFADAGLREMFYHADRPHEANTLAAAMLGFGPRSMMDEDDREEIDGGELRMEIETRLRRRIAGLNPAIAMAAGFIVEPEALRSVEPDRKAA
jgi:enoyl-CoA hydratase/carnithine racemase